MFFLYFSIPSEAWPFASEPQKAKPFEVKLLLGYTISIIAAHAPGLPMPQGSNYGLVWLLAPLKKL